MNKNFDAVVIGAGPGGYVAAIRLAQLGKKTAVIEKEYVGGVCLNVGCIPSKALIHAASVYWDISHEAPEMGITAAKPVCDLPKMQTWRAGIVKKLTGGVANLLKSNGVETISGTAVFKDKSTIEVTGANGKDTITAKDFIIATGSRVVQIPAFPFNGKNILDSTQALELTTLPKKMIVIGGGFIGLEIGTVYAKLGTEVTVVESGEQLLGSVDSDCVQVVTKKLKSFGVTVYTGARAIGLKEKDPSKATTLHLDIEQAGKTITLESDTLLVSVGRRPNSDNIGLDKLGIKMDPRGNIITDQQSQTNVPHIYAIGDVAGAPQLAHRASMDGLLAAAAIAGEKSFKDYKTVPWAVFCDPEIATAGLSEKEAKEKGLKYHVGKFPFVALGKAIAGNATEGFVKVLIQEKTELVLGVHIVGADASTMIAEAALAIEMGACAEDVIRTIHTHPTMPEAFPEAIESALGKAIHIYKPLRKS
jgi:dihydrolipoamide dehydrogenase